MLVPQYFADQMSKKFNIGSKPNTMLDLCILLLNIKLEMWPSLFMVLQTSFCYELNVFFSLKGGIK